MSFNVSYAVKKSLYLFLFDELQTV